MNEQNILHKAVKWSDGVGIVPFKEFSSYKRNRMVVMLEFLLNFTFLVWTIHVSFLRKKTFCSGNNSLLWLTQDISFYTKLIYSNSFNPLLWATAGHRSSLRRRGVWSYPAKCGLVGLACLWEHCSELSGRFSIRDSVCYHARNYVKERPAIWTPNLMRGIWNNALSLITNENKYLQPIESYIQVL